MDLDNILLKGRLVWSVDSQNLLFVSVGGSPSEGVLKFKVDWAARGKPGPTGIVGVLHNSKGEVLLSFLNPIRIKDSNEALVLATLEALRLYVSSFYDLLVAESDLSNAITWILRKGVTRGNFATF